MSDDISTFLDVGLQKYPEAIVAVQAFEDRILTRIRSVIGMLPNSEWEAVGEARKARGRDPESGTYLSVWRFIRSKKQGEAWLDAGIWWNWQFSKETCVYYASIGKGNDAPLAFDYVNTVDRICVTSSGGEAYLYRPATTVETLESDLSVLIKARLAQPIAPK